MSIPKIDNGPPFEREHTCNADCEVRCSICGVYDCLDDMFCKISFEEDGWYCKDCIERCGI